MADERSFKLRIISPDRIFYEGEAIMLELNTVDGIVGIYKNHMPMTYIIEPGVMRITESEESVKEAALHSGFMQILQEEITVLAEVVEWPEEIDENRAKEAQIRAERRLAMKEANLNAQRAELALRRALTRQEVKQNKR
jgi:F-type H+-transporting ATPase subunit epsilon